MSACPSCAAELAGRFCSSCGERRREPDDLALRTFLAHVAETFTSLDGRVARSVRLLLTRPGALAADFVRGARVRHVRPLQLFLFANVLYFLLQPWTRSYGLATRLGAQIQGQLYSVSIVRPLVVAHLQASGEPAPAYFARYDALCDELSRSLVLLLVPLVAALFAILHAGRRRFVVEHLTLAFESVAWMLLVVWIALVTVARLVLEPHGVSDRALDAVSGLAACAANATWFACAFRRFYGTWRTSSWVRGVLAAVLFLLVLNAYRLALFFVTYTVLFAETFLRV